MRGGISAAQWIFHRAMGLCAGEINFTAQDKFYGEEWNFGINGSFG